MQAMDVKVGEMYPLNLYLWFIANIRILDFTGFYVTFQKNIFAKELEPIAWS